MASTVALGNSRYRRTDYSGGPRKCFEKMQKKKHEQRTIIRKVWLWLSLATTAILGGSTPRPFSRWAEKAGKVRIYIKNMQRQIALVMEH